MCHNGADRMSNSVDPDQTAPLGSWSALFAQTLEQQFVQGLHCLP